jgi:hypothetical protein
MASLTLRRVTVVSAAVVLVLSAGLAAPTTLAPEDYTLSIDDSIDIPDRSVTIEGTEYDVRAFGRFAPGDTISVDVTAPAGREYRVNLYNWKIQVEDTYAMTGSGEAVLETDDVPPGTYFVAVVNDGFQKVFPVVVEGYDLTLSTTDSVERGTTVDVSLSVTQQASTDQPNAVQVVLGNDSEAMRVEATRTDSGSYEAEVSTDSLSPGDYALYGVIRGDEETDDGEKISLAVTDRFELTVTEPPTSTPTPTATPADSGDEGTGGGDAGGGDTGGGDTSGDTGGDSSTATPTQTPTPATMTTTPTATSTPESTTPTATAAPATTTPTVTPATSTATPTNETATPTSSPTPTPTAPPTTTVAADDPTTPQPTTRPPTQSATAGDGAGFGTVIALLAVLVGTLLLARRR